MNLLEVSNISKTYGSGEAAIYDQTIFTVTHSPGTAQTADRALNVSDGILTDLGRCAV